MMKKQLQSSAFPLQHNSPPMKPAQAFNPHANAMLIYIGVAIASGGVALYTPIIVSETGLHYSGFWAAAILFCLNLGRVLGSLAGTRFSQAANHPWMVTFNILLEGFALYCMAFLQQAWALSAFALLAGLGSGLSFPGLKNYLLKLRELDQSSIFSKLALAIRCGLVFGYLMASWIPHDHLKLVFLIVLITFCIYGIMMLFAMRAIHARDQQALPEPRPFQPAGSSLPARPDARLPKLFYLSNALFWCFAVQPMIGFSLHIPKYTPSIPVSTPFWIGALIIIFFQIPVSKMAVRTRDHFRFLLIAYVALFASFMLVSCMMRSPAAVVSAAILLSFAQVFYGPSLDVLTARFADATGADTGQMMSRQMLYQSMGNMIGSLTGGVLFDLAQYLQLPVINWVLLSLAALCMAILSRRYIPLLYQRARRDAQMSHAGSAQVSEQV